ncbi:MAG: SBBP repeat-containing protein, partial [Betaproteobacteria bacterium]
IQVGGTQINANVIDRNAAQIQSWASALSADGDVLLYGCDVAQTPDGIAMVDALARLSGADVAASVDLTGSGSMGGDWNLEYHTGQIDTDGIVSSYEQSMWAHLLQDEPHEETVMPAPAMNATGATVTSSDTAAVIAMTPLVFEADVGQAGGGFDFISHGSDYAVGLDHGDVTIAVDNGSATALVHLEVVGKNANVTGQAEELLRSKTNYLVGSAEQWHQDIANYGAIRYENIYDGIDLRYYGTQRQLEYDFIVNPNANAGAIQLRFGGAQSVAIADNGDLVLTLDDAGHTVQFKAPIAYQDGVSGREAVASHYVIAADGSVGFATGDYDTSRALVIDPVLSYASYFGGSAADLATGVAVDTAGNVYVAGYTSSTAGVLDAILGTGSGEDVFVTQFFADLSTRLYTTYISGSANDRGMAIALDSSGNAYVTGYTKSSNFPPATGYDASLAGSQDAFVFKLNSTGNALLYSTYLGGSGSGDVGNGIAVDASGSAYVTGFASSADFTGIADPSYAGGDAFVTKLNAAGTALDYSVLLGGSSSDIGHAIAVDGAGRAVVVGETSSNDFAPTAGAYQATSGGGIDVFVTRLDSTGGKLYSTYLGGTGQDIAYAVTLDAAGKIYLTGETASSDFDVTTGAFAHVHASGKDAFLSILDPAATASAQLIYSTGLGNNAKDDGGHGIGLDAAGRVYVIGYTNSTGAGASDAFVAQVAPISSGVGDLVYYSTIGGSGQDHGNAGVYSNGKVYVAGDTASSSGVAKALGNDTTYNGGTDAFVAVFTVNVPPVVTLPPGSLAYTENAGAVALAATLTLTDSDSTTLAGATLQIGAGYVSTEDMLAFNNSNVWGITGTWTAGTATLALTGSASVANYQAALRSVTYENVSEKPSTNLRTVTVSVNDGIQASTAVNRQVTVAAVDDAPVNTVPTAQSTPEDTPLVFSSGAGNVISISDVDADLAPVQVSLTVTNGNLTLMQTTGLTFVTGNGSANATMTFTGTVTSINLALNGLQFGPAANFNGTASLQLVTSDQGNTGSGGPLSTTSSVTITVNGVNDRPINNVPGPQSSAQNGTLIFSAANGNAITVSDVDAGSTPLQVTLTANHGIVTVMAIGSLAMISGSGTATVTLSGNLNELNSALEGLRFEPDFAFGGLATLQIATNDGNVTNASDVDVININVSSNVAPVILTSGSVLAVAENDGATAIDALLTLTDSDTATIDHATVRVAGNYVSGEDRLAFTDQLGISGIFDAATGTLQLSGIVNTLDYQTALRSVTYENTSDNPSIASRTISFVANDGFADGAIATRTVTLSAANDAPSIATTLTQSIGEDSTLVFSAANGNAIVVSDADAGSSAIQVALSATQGTITLAQINGLIVVSDGNGTSAVTFSGTVANINAALNGLRFAPTANFQGAASLTIATDDQGNSGAGGAQTSSSTIAISVAARNDAPIGSDHLAVTLEDTRYTFAVADFGFSDANDSPGDTFADVRIANLPSIGVLLYNGISVSAGQLVTTADIALGKLQFGPAMNGNGIGYASFTFQVQDSGGTVGGGVDLDLSARTMTIDVTPVNDAPAGADTTVTSTENTTYTFVAADFAFNDPNDSTADALFAVTIATLPAAGSLTLSGNAVSSGQVISAANIVSGDLQFTPASGVSGAGYATFNFRLQDTGGTLNGGVALEAAQESERLAIAAGETGEGALLVQAELQRGQELWQAAIDLYQTVLELNP